MGIVALPGVDMKLVAGVVKRGKKRKPLDMVPVGVADQDVGGAGALAEALGTNLDP